MTVMRGGKRMVQRALSSASPNRMNSANNNKIPSLGFSGAGFLGVYHCGVYACLLEQGLLLAPGEVPTALSNTTHKKLLSGVPASSRSSSRSRTILSGVSAGSIVAAGIASGVHPDDGMNLILKISQRTREKTSKLMDVLTPRFSLIDQVEDLLRVEMKKALGGTDEASGYNDYDVDLLLRRTEGGSLRIGLMDRRQLSKVMSSMGSVYVPEAYVYVHCFRNVEDVVAASVLSSFIPGLTGPLQGATCPHNASVQRASRQLSQLMRAIPHAIQQEGSHQPVVLQQNNGLDDDDEPNGDDEKDDVPYTHFFDGGLAHLFPTVNESTIIVSPFNGRFSNPCICPPMPTTASNANSIMVAQEAKRFYDSIMGQFGRSTSNGVVDQTKNKDPQEESPSQEPVERNHTTTNNSTTRLSFPSTIRVSPVAELGLNLDNLETMRRMSLSSDDATMEAYYEKGYTDAKHFLRENHLLTKISSRASVPQ